MAAKKPVVTIAQIESRIFLIRGHSERVELKVPGTRRRPPCGEKFMLDSNLAAPCGTEIRVYERVQP